MSMETDLTAVFTRALWSLVSAMKNRYEYRLLLVPWRPSAFHLFKTKYIETLCSDFSQVFFRKNATTGWRSMLSQIFGELLAKNNSIFVLFWSVKVIFLSPVLTLSLEMLTFSQQSIVDHSTDWRAVIFLVKTFFGEF